MRKCFLSVILAFLQTVNVFAQSPDIDGMTEADFLAQANSSERLKANMIDSLELLDVNLDKAISITEIEEMIKAPNFADLSDETEKDATITEIKKAFQLADSDHNNMLCDDEKKLFGQSIQTFLIKQQFKKMDRNGDGIYNMADIPSQEESMKALEDAQKRMQENMKKLDAMDKNEMADNFLKNISTSIAKEDYYQMDKDHNKCVTSDEYTEYQFSMQGREVDEDMSEDEKIILPKEAYSELYNRIKKESPDCLTIDEYVDDYTAIGISSGPTE